MMLFIIFLENYLQKIENILDVWADSRGLTDNI